MRLIATCIMAAGIAVSATDRIPDNFRFSMPYIPGATSTVWDLPGSSGELHVEYGRHYCLFLGDLEVPAGSYVDPYTGETRWRCPEVSVRHLTQIMMSRENGKCRGFVCEYDVAYPGPQAVMVTDEVPHCPDIVVTVYDSGRMKVVGAKYYRPGDDPGRYFKNGMPAGITRDISHETKPKQFGKCADQVYRDQVAFYRGPDWHREHTRTVRIKVDDGWDGR